MKVEHWLRNSLVIKMRNRLSSWMREDFIAFAESEFGTTELTKVQLSQFVEKLKHPQVTKPPRELSDKYRIQTSSLNGTPVEIVFKDNPGSTDWPLSHWYLSDGRAAIRFASEKDCVGWAFTLIKNYPKDSWSGLSFRWKEITSLSNFTVEETGFEHIPLSEDLSIKLKKLKRNNQKLTVPLPDNASLEKQYWGLVEGDKLKGNGETLIVKQVRSNLDGPPTIVFERITNEQ